MSKSLGYYTSGSVIDTLIEEFGDRLENLTITDKLHLQGILSLFLAAISDSEEEYDLATAELDYPLVVSPNVERALIILSEAPNEGTFKGLLLALANQIHNTAVVYNDQLYTATVTALSENGVEFDAAKRAACVVASDHLSLHRTPQQQVLVTQAWQQLNQHNCDQDELLELEEAIVP